jgi:hypothetical protein
VASKNQRLFFIGEIFLLVASYSVSFNFGICKKITQLKLALIDIFHFTDIIPIGKVKFPTNKKRGDAMCQARREELVTLAQAIVEAERRDPGMLQEVMEELLKTEREAHHDLAGALREEGVHHRDQTTAPESMLWLDLLLRSCRS